MVAIQNTKPRSEDYPPPSHFSASPSLYESQSRPKHVRELAERWQITVHIFPVSVRERKQFTSVAHTLPPLKKRRHCSVNFLQEETLAMPDLGKGSTRIRAKDQLELGRVWFHV